MIEETRDRSLRETVEYPESDGQPMGETDLHVHALVDALQLLSDHFAARDDVYVGANNFLYWTEGDPSCCVSPDTYVVFGVPPGRRRVFKTWVEGRTPAFVLEITSRKTRRNDQREKLSTYRDELCVPEYFLFDPEQEWIPGHLRAFRDDGQRYRELAPDLETGRIRSEQLGLELGVVRGELRFYLPGAAEPLPTRAELAARAKAEAEQQRAEAERQRAEAERQRAEAERQRAEAERQRAEAERKQAEAGQQRERAEQAEAELTRMREELERLRGSI
ncbi:MAG: Uma2 family endonuclease [Planctomycetota bacterium]